VVPHELVASGDRRERLLDLLLVGGLLAFGQAEVWNSKAELLIGPLWLNAVVFALMSLALLWRRSRPLLVLTAQCGVLAAAVVAAGGASQSLGWLLPLIAGVYAVAAAPGRVRLVPTTTLVVGLIVVLAVVDVVHGRSAPWTDYLAEGAFLGMVVGGWLLGSFARTRRLYAEQALRAVELRARALEEHTLRTAAEQRNRIAHELHDVLAHGLAVSVRQAEAGLSRMDSDPERARASFEAIASTGRHSLDDVRRLLALLREPTSSPVTPVSGLGDVRALTERLTQAGMQVELDLPEDLDPAAVPDGLGLAIHRIVQESLTNALRHGGAGRATVAVSRQRHGLLVEIVDDGCGMDGDPVPGGGLTGMRERAVMFGGSLTTDSRAGEGFVVRASLPWAALS
jgi:signal transduction histidine kinase